MKKIKKSILFIIGILIVSICSGCGIYSTIDLNEVKEEMLNLKTRNIDILKIKEVLSENTSFGTLKELEEEEMIQLGINKEYIDEKNHFLFMIEQNEEEDSFPYTSYIIVKPAEDKKEMLKEQLDNYYKNLFETYMTREDATMEGVRHIENVMKKEIDGYLVYILSYDNEEVWKKIEENSHSLLFENPKELSLEEFTQIFSLKQEHISEYEAVLSENSVSLYIIVKPRNGKAENVKKVLDKYMSDLEKEYIDKEEYQIINNRVQTEVGSYLIYIISKDNENILNTIKNVIVKGNS